jgi:tetratricopeptide (TPR) repeat protein
MMRRIVALAAAGLVLAAAPPAPAAESAQALLARGLAAYEKGEYEAAAADFREVLELGHDDPVVHYDLGNAYFKTGRLGRAIWHYRRAHALAPRDGDVAANLEYARFLAVDRVEGRGEADRRVETWLDRVTPPEAFRLAGAVWVLAGLAGVLWQLAPRGADVWRRTAGGALVVWVLAFAVALTLARRADSLREAVVLAEEAVVRSAPGPDFPTAFVLHEGAEVAVEGTRGEWTEISLSGDLRGWIESSRIARL